MSAHSGVRDRSGGSSTVWLLGCVLVLALGAWCTATLAAVAGLRHRVTDAADEAALAAAAALPATRAVACARAAAVAAQARADLDECVVGPDGTTVRVGLSRPLPGLLGAAGRARAVARAGPARGRSQLVPGPAPRPPPVGWRYPHTWLNRCGCRGPSHEPPPYGVPACPPRVSELLDGRKAVDLSLDTRAEGDKTVVSVAGEIDVYTAPKLREQIVQLVEDGRYHLVVDMEQVEFLDSTGLGVLVGGLKRVRAHDGSLHLVCTQERILKIFRITGLTKVFPIHATVADAVAARD